jgi:glucose-1-phosphate thymidylyltransferase
MKGILLAGGTGSRLWPITATTSKQLLPVYDKPMVYYPLSTLMLAGVKDILIITSPRDKEDFFNLLGDGSKLGLNLSYQTQEFPRGIAEALIIGEEFLGGESCLLILGDNIFHGAGLGSQLKRILSGEGAHIFVYEVSNPSEYGVLELNSEGLASLVTEKPIDSNSNLAITGLYYFDNKCSELAKEIIPSKRGELEITSVINKYLDLGKLKFTILGRGTAWLDTGTPKMLNDASNYIRIIEERTSLKIACLEEISLNNNWINRSDFEKLIDEYNGSSYGMYLKRVIEK